MIQSPVFIRHGFTVEPAKHIAVRRGHHPDDIGKANSTILVAWSRVLEVEVTPSSGRQQSAV